MLEHLLTTPPAPSIPPVPYIPSEPVKPGWVAKTGETTTVLSQLGLAFLSVCALSYYKRKH